MERNGGNGVSMFVPQEGQFLIVMLPGEATRAVVNRVVNDDTVLVEMVAIPVSRQHMHRRGDIIAATRVQGPLGETWEAMDERLMLAQQAAEAVARKGKRNASKSGV